MKGILTRLKPKLNSINPNKGKITLSGIEREGPIIQRANPIIKIPKNSNHLIFVIFVVIFIVNATKIM